MSCDFLSTGGCPTKLPEPGYVLSPFVKVKFQKGGSTITVGNKSSEENNHEAVIKDFEWGYSDGLECRITILDQKGGSFVQFMEDLIKDYKCATPGMFTMSVEFGWIKADCPDGFAVKKTPTAYCFSCDNVECNFTGGRFMFLITGTDIGPTVFAGKYEPILGTEKDPMPLTDAIRKMFTDDRFPPTISSVQFLKRTDGGGTEPIQFKEGGTRGPKGVWSGNGLDKINAAMNWLRAWLTSDDKTIIPVFNSECSDASEIIFWEDFKPKCNESKDWDANCIGSYIVNGGKKSPVIEFNPKIRWNFMNLSNVGGNMGENKVVLNDDGKVKGVDCPSLSRDRIPSAGATQSVPVDRNQKDINGGKSAEETNKAATEQLRSWKLFTEPIEADLVIVGDPTICRPKEAVYSKNVKIVFLNPYHIFSGGGGCGEWMAEPPCNEILSNNAWLVRYVNHRISEGKYTTTIGVFLGVPGEDYDIGTPLGGPGADGWVPPANC